MYDPDPQRVPLRFYPKPAENGVTDEMKVAGMAVVREMALLNSSAESIVEAVFLAMEAERAKPKPISDRHRV